MSVEVAIVGGGIAGASAAIALARAGREVLVLERESQLQHKVCGEFLSAETIAALRELDVDPAKLGAKTIEAVRFADAKHVTEAKLPFRAMAMTRKTLDAALLRKAEELGANVSRGTRVLSLEREAANWRLKCEAREEREEIFARAIFLASGKHDAGGLRRPEGCSGGLWG